MAHSKQYSLKGFVVIVSARITFGHGDLPVEPFPHRENAATKWPVRSSTFYLFNHVAEDMAVLMLRAEHDDLRIRVDLHVVSGWPVKQVVRFDRFLRAVCIGRGELAAHDRCLVNYAFISRVTMR